MNDLFSDPLFVAVLFIAAVFIQQLLLCWLFVRGTIRMLRVIMDALKNSWCISAELESVAEIVAAVNCNRPTTGAEQSTGSD